MQLHKADWNLILPLCVNTVKLVVAVAVGEESEDGDEGGNVIT